MQQQFLEQIGLTKDQVLVYDPIIQGGLLPARVISQKTGLKRGLVYKVLEQLIELGLIEKREEKGRVALFRATHPSNLKNILDKRREDVKNAEVSLESVLPALTSSFNLIAGKPNVQFFEGLEGVRRVLEDSLSAEGEIYSFADIESIEKYIHDVNTDYVAKRDRFGVKKKAILLDTPFARNFLKDYHRETTDLRLIKSEANPFHTVMQIYNNKISYITLSDKEMIGVIIEDPHIYEMHKYLFEFVWGRAELLDNNTAITKTTT